MHYKDIAEEEAAKRNKQDLATLKLAPLLDKERDLENALEFVREQIREVKNYYNLNKVTNE